MKLQIRIAVVLGALALAVAPAMAVASQPTNTGQGDGVSNGPAYQPDTPNGPPGPNASPPEKAKAYGFHCKGFSKKHVKGEKGTEFSRCVTAMAKAATDEDATPREACKGFSKKHVKGEKGTEFSRCVVAAAQVKKDEQQV